MPCPAMHILWYPRGEISFILSISLPLVGSVGLFTVTGFLRLDSWYSCTFPPHDLLWPVKSEWK